MNMSLITEDVKNAVNQLLSVAELKEENILVVGCSSSEILGNKIGTTSSEEAGREVFKAIYDIVRPRGIFLAAQCCEHLNRALVIEAACLEKYGYERVSVVPWIHAGGSFASAAYRLFEEPAVTEHIKADAGIDIGDTLIGMHLRDVAVPVRIEQKSIGEAHVVCARTRPRLIGGERARYTL
ncbi:TIGR01440 family protein [Treponema socranskii]|uniref:TIGR01440 family protein n=1 Tax=Treponema socranskii TaxID=53419 RepID=UPI0028719724|nr:TIGR01440 family protein [Treponema socranskii]MDR9858645.1 TIGR01440 family protein [Treponema socranskii]